MPHVHVTTNPEWWEYEAEPDLFQMMQNPVKADDPQIDCWCSDEGAAERYGLNHFGWKDDAEKRGLSDDPSCIALGHGSGFAALNIAYLMGCDPIILLGHDMKYPNGYDGRQKITGGKRHYFGEYHKAIQHWPSVKVGPNGELLGLIQCYVKVSLQIKRGERSVQIINCTPGSALTYFPQMELKEALSLCT